MVFGNLCILVFWSKVASALEVFMLQDGYTRVPHFYKDPAYSTSKQFLRQSTRRLPVPGCTNTRGWHVKNEPIMTHVACEPTLCSVVRSSMHPCPGNWVAIWGAVVFYARAAQVFSAVENKVLVLLSCWICLHIHSYSNACMFWTIWTRMPRLRKRSFLFFESQKADRASACAANSHTLSV